jgi:cystathionine beta-lyase
MRGKTGRGDVRPFRAVKVDRTGLDSLQEALTPEPIRAAGFSSLGGAEFDFKTAPCIRHALARYAEGGYYGFTVEGEEYARRVAWWMEHARGWQIDPLWVIPVLGTIFSVATCIRMLLGPEDALIVQPPIYGRYEQAASRLGRRCVHNPLVLCGDRYEMDLDGLERLMADQRNKLLVICNPANPVGRVWSGDELERVAELSKRYGTVVLSDEIFAEVAFNGARTIPYLEAAGSGSPSISLTSIGKSFGCTGLNFANAIIENPTLRERFAAQRTRDHFGSIDPFGYRALMAAYTPEGLEWQRKTLALFTRNRRIVARAVESLSLSRMFPTEGTFVGWIEWRGLDVRGNELQEILEREALVELEPGGDFGEGLDNFSRINLASTNEQTELAMRRLVKTLMPHVTCRNRVG